LTKLRDNKNPNRNRAFTYDALTRLTAVSGGSGAPTGSPQWRQKYSYDRFGNRTGVARERVLRTFLSLISSLLTPLARNSRKNRSNKTDIAPENGYCSQ